MNLQEMIQKYNDDTITLDNNNIKISDLLTDNRYTLLLGFLSDNNLVYSNDIKKLSQQDYDRLKVKLPSQPGIGDTKVDLYFKKLDEIRRNNNDSIFNGIPNNVSGNLIFSKMIGQIQTSQSYTIDINILKYKGGSEYLDIRKVKNDGTRKNGISIKKENIPEFISIVNSFNEDEITEELSNDKNEPEPSEITLNVSEDEDNSIIEDMFIELLDNSDTSIKKEILDNEKKLLNELDEKYALSIKLFIKKIESLPLDGDIYKFLKNDSILDIKKELYDEIHKKRLYTAIDIINKYNPENLPYTSINTLKHGDLVNTNTICAIANNFNNMLGMYYDDKEDILILKCQIHNDTYADNWIVKNQRLLYYLQNEKEPNYKSLEFRNVPNRICRDIILGNNNSTKVYLFYRNERKQPYIFDGEYRINSFAINNKCIIIEKI